jgi:hypothetical protein
VEGGDDFSFSPIFDENMCVVLEVDHEGFWSSVHSLLQSHGESTDLEGLPFFGGFGFLKERSLNWSAMKSSLPKVTLESPMFGVGN